MAIVAGFDVHRAQITFDALDTETGEVSRGRIDATPAAVAGWAAVSSELRQFEVAGAGSGHRRSEHSFRWVRAREHCSGGISGSRGADRLAGVVVSGSLLCGRG